MISAVKRQENVLKTLKHPIMQNKFEKLIGKHSTIMLYQVFLWTLMTITLNVSSLKHELERRN